MAETVEAPSALGMGADFPEPPPAPPAEVAPPAPQVFAREIDLKDGSGVQRFEADTWEGLVDKLAVAQEHATRKIRELSGKVKVEPERDVKLPTLQAPSAADLAAVKEGFTTDPIAAWNKMFELQTGMNADSFRQQEQARLIANMRGDAERKFINRHKEDFHNVPENAQKIQAFMEKEQLPWTPRNLEYAFQELTPEFVPKQVSPVAIPANLPPPPVPPNGQRDIQPPPVSIPANFGARVVEPPADGGLNAAEMARIANLPVDQMKQRIVDLYRRGQR